MINTPCRACGAEVRSVVDDAGFSHVVEDVALTVVGEALAVLSGRRTFAVSSTRRAADEFWLRTRWHIGKPSHRRIIAVHVCGQPIPDAWRVPVAPPRPAADPEEIPF